MSADLRHGRWQTTLADVTCDALIFDAPFSVATHDASTTRSDTSDPAGLTPGYESFGLSDVREFCESWADRCRGWMVSVTDSELFPTWRDEMSRVGRYAFRAPVSALIPGMSVRMQGDGPSSWTLYCAVSRPRSNAFVGGWTTPGGYGPIAMGSDRGGGGRGKPRALMDALVRDYSRPGDLVCDPFAGWGTTLASALAYKRRAVGAEMDPEAYREAVRRLARPLQVDMFAAEAAGEQR